MKAIIIQSEMEEAGVFFTAGEPSGKGFCYIWFFCARSNEDELEAPGKNKEADVI